MSHASITVNGTWIRRIHDSWANTSGYRTDIPQSVLESPIVKRVAFILDDHRAILVPIEAMRSVLIGARKRSNGCVGPYNVDPHHSTVNGMQVPMDIRVPKVSDVAA